MEPNPGNQGTFLTTYTFDEIYNLIKKTFVDKLKMCDMGAKDFFIQQSIPQQSGNTRQFNEIEFSTYARTKPEGVAAVKASIGIGYHKVMKAKRIALELDMTYEARSWNEWYRVTEIANELAQTAPNRIDLDMVHMAVTFANAASYVDMDGFIIDTTTGDGLSIANAAHTLPFSGTTYTNIVPGGPTFSKPALEAALTVGRNNTLDGFGIPHCMNWNTIFSSGDPTTVNDIRQFLHSITDVTQANPNVINGHKGFYQHLILNNLDTDANGFRDTTKSAWWGIAALGGGSRGDRLQAYYGIWEPPHMLPGPNASIGNNAIDFSKDIWRFGVRAGYGLTFVRPAGIVYSFAA